jgi:hypothetical protein
VELTKEQKWMLSRALAGLYRYNTKFRDLQIYRSISLFRKAPKTLPDAKICFAMYEKDYIIVCASTKKWDEFKNAEIVWFNTDTFTKSVGANKSSLQRQAEIYALEWITNKNKEKTKKKVAI